MTTVTHTLVFLLISQRQYRLKLLFNTCLQFVSLCRDIVQKAGWQLVIVQHKYN